MRARALRAVARHPSYSPVSLVADLFHRALSLSLSVFLSLSLSLPLVSSVNNPSPIFCVQIVKGRVADCKCSPHVERQVLDKAMQKNTQALKMLE